MQKFLLGLTLAAAGLAGATTSVSAATVDTIYAQSIVSVTPGARPETPRRVDYVGPNRYTAANILGAPDKPFYSLGLGGSIILDFGRLVRTPGRAVEVTFNRQEQGDQGFEYFSIFVSTTADFAVSSLLGNFDNEFTGNNTTRLSYVLDGDVGDFRYVRIVDTTTGDATQVDGTDIESIGFAPVPVPAAGLLLGGALMGLGALRRRARKAA